MNIINLGFSNCNYISEIHKELKNKFDFPEYYGENLDALWDCLDYYTSQNLIVMISGFQIIEKQFDNYASKMKEVFKRVSLNCPNIQFKFNWCDVSVF